MDNIWKNITPNVSTRKDVVAALGEPSEETTDEDYGGTTNLHLLDYDDPQVSIYLKDDKVFLILLVVTSHEVFEENAKIWKTNWGNHKPNFQAQKEKIAGSICMRVLVLQASSSLANCIPSSFFPR